MPNKSNKLPYVFVEIDEIHKNDASKRYDSSEIDAEDEPLIPEPLPPNYYPPAHQASVYSPQAVQPYPYPYPYGHPQYGYQDSYSHSIPLPSKGKDPWFAKSSKDLYEEEYDLDPYDDFDDDFDDYESYLEDGPENDALNLETVVIPVFKNFDDAKGASPLSAASHPYYPSYAQLPLTSLMPFFSTLPYAYNPYRVPFTGPAWPMSNYSGMPGVNNVYASPVNPGFRQRPINPNFVPQVQPKPIRNQMLPRTMPAQVNNPISQPRPDNRFVPRPNNQFQGPRNASQAGVASPQNQLNMPAEAREALLQNQSAQSQSGASQSAQNQSVAQPMASAPKTAAPMVANAANSPAKTQTITANTDAVSVSVSVLPPKTSAGNQPSATVAKTSDASTNATQPIVGAASITGAAVTESKPKKKASEGKQPKESFQEMAMRENAEKTNTKLTEDIDDPTQMGKPLLDASAIETSEMFSTPAKPMNETMTSFFKSSRRKHILMIIIVALILAVIVATVVCAFAVWSGVATIAFDESNIPSLRFGSD